MQDGRVVAEGGTGGLVRCRWRCRRHSRDLLAGRDGDETTAQRWPGCPSGVDVELWSMQGAGHIPRYRDEAPELVLDFLLAHQRAP